MAADMISLVAPPDPSGLTFAVAEATLTLASSSGDKAGADLVVDSRSGGATITTTTVNVARGDLLFVGLNLGRAAAIGVLGQAACDFSNTAETTRIEQLDSSGNFLRDINLPDVNRNVLSGAPVAAPEPATFGLTGLGLIVSQFLLKKFGRKK